MPLAVLTSRISYRGPDALDISRKGNDPVGVAFAPSWEILAPRIRDRREGVPWSQSSWEAYADAYTAEMRVSYARNRRVWDDLLGRQAVTLCCYCTDPLKCHRTVLAGILEKLGAAYHGERARSAT